MPVNFLPQENLFLPVYKFIFSRKEIFFLPQRNLFPCGRKFISFRMPQNFFPYSHKFSTVYKFISGCKLGNIHIKMDLYMGENLRTCGKEKKSLRT